MRPARRNRSQSARRSRPTRARGVLAALRRHPAFAVLMLLLGLGAVVLERRGVLPEPVAVAVREIESWVAPVLEELGVEDPGAGAPDAPAPAPHDYRNADDQAAVGQALALLDRVRVAPERPRGYDRETWPHWLDGDGDCQDARQEVVMAESLERVRLSANGCRVKRGLWRDAYTGETTRNPTRLDVDHMVPLAEAFRSGGRDWSTERRAAFANDLEDSRTLIAVSASVNRAKGDQGPEEWLPPLAACRCRYVADWVAVKVRWSLSMDERERVTAGNLLRECASQAG